MGLAAPLLALLALAPTLAGCTGPPVSGNPSADEGRGEYLYRCPGEDRFLGAPCALVLTGEGERATDAFLAAHPSRPGVLAVAAQLAAPLPTWAALVAGGQGTAYYDCQGAVFASADGGRTWSSSLAPAPPPPPEAQPLVARCVSQPSVAFDAEGVLHLLANARIWSGSAPATLLAWETTGAWVDPGAYRVHNQVYYARSADGGVTWAAPVVLALEANHPWLARDHGTGALYASWRNLGPGEATTGGAGWTSEVAWSLDGGLAWARLDPASRPACHLPSPVVLHAGDALLACTNEDAGEGQAAARVYALDRERRTLVPRGAVPYGADRWAAAGLASFPDGGLGLHLRETDAEPTERWTRVATRILRSPDGGRTWGAAVDLGTLFEAAWDRVEAVAAGADAHGGNHVLVELVRGGDAPAYEVRHLVLGVEGARLHDAVVASGALGNATSPAPPWIGARTLGNPYDGMAWDGALGRIATTPPGGDGALSLFETWAPAVGEPRGASPR